MKNILAASVAAILCGCGGSDTSTPPSQKDALVQAYIHGSDITAQLQADINANCQATVPRGWYYTSAPVTIRNNNCGVKGAGDWNGGTVIQPQHVGNAFSLENCQHCYLDGLNIQGGSQGEYSVVLNGDFLPKISNLRIDGAGNGIMIKSTTEAQLNTVKLRNMTGDTGIWFVGTDKARSYRATLTDIRADNPPEGDGSRYTTWVRMDSYAYSLVLNKVALLNGGYGFVMEDNSNTGSSYPVWAFAYDLELDHQHVTSAALNGGEGFYATVSWFGSTGQSHCIDIADTFRGEVSIGQSRVMGCAKAGVNIGNTNDVLITGSHIGDNSTLYPDVYHGVEVSPGATGVLLTGNHIGNLIGVDGSNQKSGGADPSTNYLD